MRKKTGSKFRIYECAYSLERQPYYWIQELLEFTEYTGRMEKNDGKCESDDEKKDGNLRLGRLYDSDCGGALPLSDGSGAGQRLH